MHSISEIGVFKVVPFVGVGMVEGAKVWVLENFPDELVDGFSLNPFRLMQLLGNGKAQDS